MNQSIKYDIVADIYDSYVNTDYDIEFWLSVCRKYPEVLELACGTGRITVPLARAGIRVTALDISESLLKILEDKKAKDGLNIDIVKADMCAFELNKRYPFIFIPFQSFHELTDESLHNECLKSINMHLDDNGILCLTIHNPANLRVNDTEYRGAEFHHPATQNLIAFKYRRYWDGKSKMGMAKQIYEEYNKAGEKTGERVFENRYFIFGDGKIESLAQNAGFVIESVYGGYDFGPLTAGSPFRIYLLKKTC